MANTPRRSRRKRVLEFELPPLLTSAVAELLGPKRMRHLPPDALSAISDACQRCAHDVVRALQEHEHGDAHAQTDAFSGGDA